MATLEVFATLRPSSIAQPTAPTAVYSITASTGGSSKGVLASKIGLDFSHPLVPVSSRADPEPPAALVERAAKARFAWSNAILCSGKRPAPHPQTVMFEQAESTSKGR